jgi:hypothetical protein
MKGKQRLLPTIIEQAIKWKHAVCGYPINTTWSKAANAGNVVGWPLLTGKKHQQVLPGDGLNPQGPYEPRTENFTSTKTPFEECHLVAALRGKKMKEIYVRTYDTGETSFSDQTGKFPKQTNATPASVPKK